ncbi:MFS transporter [Novosphingobium profundi]|uniref:MFS transporter n=1 Tax=Novosphingobium profundi TaxID=1774954 RepID=UPI001BDA0C7A|nr:MFS transporter [Novosphingobium profundi]MBT0669244.1 MFS transporter [Novosphingobium profundi]
MAKGQSEHGVTACCAAVLLAAGYSLQAFAFSMPGLVHDWALADRLVGPLLACAMFGLMAGYVLVAPLADRFGARRVIAASMAALAFASLASLLARDVLALGAWRVAIGAASGGAIPPAVSIASQQGDTRWQGPRVVAVYTAYSLGFLTAALVSLWLIPLAGWRAPWTINVVLALASALGARRLPDSPTTTRPTHRRDERPPIEGPRALLAGSRRLGTVLFWVLFPVGLALFYTLQSWLPLLATRGGATFTGAVAVTGAFTLGNMIGALPMIWCADRWGPLRALAVMGLVSLAGIALLVLSLSLAPRMLLAAALLAGIGIGASQKGMTSAAAQFYPPAIRSTGLGWALGVGRIGAAAGPLLLGLGAQADWLSVFLPLPLLVLILVPVWLDRRYGRIDRGGPPSH